MDLQTLAQHVGELSDRDKEIILKLISHKEAPVSIPKGGLYYMAHQATSKGTLTNNICIAADKANLIKDKYKVNVINPLAIMNPETSWADSMDICYDLLSLVDGVILQDDFFFSVGCIYEALYAIEENLPIYIYNALSNLLIETSHENVINKIKAHYNSDLKHRLNMDFLIDKGAAMPSTGAETREPYDSLIISRTLTQFSQPVEKIFPIPRQANKALFDIVVDIITDNAWMEAEGEPFTKVVSYGDSFPIETVSIHVKKKHTGYQLEIVYDHNKKIMSAGNVNKSNYKFDTHGIILLYCAYASKRNQRVF